ncbi:CBS domain-containing protein [Actinoplanes sp. NBRC 101535]|uniref:CBS domain-containing protein n=1 Tax=Actinoplanes sp. NBRC 101535 TaxID=3032196 RepID=UPI002557342F|nr:CBS domain-containing protein [Actinoplanes sp. NBRC 101535]
MRAWTVDDVMTEAVVAVAPDATYREVVDLLVGKRFSAVPVVDAFQRVSGVISEADLLRKIEYAGEDAPLLEGPRRRAGRAKARAGTATDLMTSPAVVALKGTSLTAAARLMDTAHVKRLPVVDDLGRLVGIVARSDLLKTHLRPDDEISADVTADVLTVLGGAVSVTVSGGVVTLTGDLDRRSSADLAVRLAEQVAGVVQVVDRFTVAFEDTVTAGVFYVA